MHLLLLSLPLDEANQLGPLAARRSLAVRLVGQRTEEEDVGSPGLEALPDGLGGLVSNREGVLRERAEHSRRGFEAGVEIGLGPLNPG